ncbi:MAG TPA: phosphocholine cytidylyltransferase family protein [Desulfobacteraceae bacterium]|nr:bifunctional IPC transferase and DIPP synthase [bacterium BMS3Abin13]HDK43486.1 phosphocholine cytidylyltransferase family protein [Desulfobacteraceae bacterium]
MKNLPAHTGFEEKQVRTALLLAAGTGSRLAPLTDRTAKCRILVNEISILERLVDTLRLHNFKRLVIVVGHQANSIRDFLGTQAGGMKITYITSPVYKTTNNIYSLWLARREIDEPFLLIESDLVFNPEMLKDMLLPDRIAVSKLQPWMNGTTVTINSHHKVKSFHKDIQKTDERQYKTVNIYSLSMQTWELVRKRLDHRISNNMVNGYYEAVFSDMVTEGCLSFTPVLFDADRWYEIDTIADLHAAALMCSLHHQSPALIPAHEGAQPGHLGLSPLRQAVTSPYSNQRWA